MTTKNLFAIILIFLCTAVAWFVLGGALTTRTHGARMGLDHQLVGNWGPPLEQSHPSVHYTAPSSARGRKVIAPAASDITVELRYRPKRKGLLRYRTYEVDFKAEYLVQNPAPIAQTLFFEFDLPDADLRYDGFKLLLGEEPSARMPEGGRITEAVRLGAGESLPISVSYGTVGLGSWAYSFQDAPRIEGFSLAMTTDFVDYDIPAGANSAKLTESTESGMRFEWGYDGVINAQAVGMEMPKLLNPGPVAARITFFAPVSLLFFFTVLTIFSAVRGVQLHPMHYFFLAAGCFAFQLLFVYLVDLIPAAVAFATAAAVSLLLVCGYLWRAHGKGLARVALLAQFAYMVLFSASFFFDGLTGITITIGAIVTLAILMMVTARVEWKEVFRPKPTAPTIAENAQAT